MNIENFTKPLFQVSVMDFISIFCLFQYQIILNELLLYSYLVISRAQNTTMSVKMASPMRFTNIEDDDPYKMEKQLANEIMETVYRLQLPFKLGNITEGRGNCFPIAMIDQLKRPEILSQLPATTANIVKHKSGHSLLRWAVKQYMEKSEHPTIIRYITQYRESEAIATGKTWTQYWKEMIKDKIWVDSVFIQSIAWYLKLDIMIILTTCTPDQPYLLISGNVEDKNIACTGPVVTLGAKSNIHYQSLLPIDVIDNPDQLNQESENSLAKPSKEITENKKAEIKNRSKSGPSKKDITNRAEEPSELQEINTKCKISSFMYKTEEKTLVFKVMPNGLTKCPICDTEVQYIMKHISKKGDCNRSLNIEILKVQFQLFNKESNRLDQVKRKRTSRIKQKENDSEKVKKVQNENKTNSRIKARLCNEDKLKADNREWKRLSLGKRKKEDHKQLKEDQNQWQRKHRRVENKSDRLREFREATMYSAVFICTCCQQRMFQSNVCLYTDELEKNINSIKHGHTQACIERSIETCMNGQTRKFICLTCVRHMKKKKIPPMSAMNGLKLKETDKEMKDQELELTELEGTLIAKNIIFQKIYQLPKSRWTALKDKLINIPLTDNDILNTLEQMPRTPNNAGLIGVALKRKKEYTNTHKHQLINPSKLFRVLEKLKSKGNPYYQFYDDHNEYKTRCKMSDPVGYDVMFYENDSVQGDIDEMVIDIESTNITDEIEKEKLHKDALDSDDAGEIEERDEIEYKTKDPVKKYQFTYNESLCMSNKYPEISFNTDESTVSVAPGEGKVPQDIMSEEDWDVKAFPHLNNLDGSNGKDQERDVRLTEQNYFIQRICNLEQRFAKSPAYMYAAIGYLEKKQLMRNINLAHTRGKEVISKSGEKSYQLEDGYRVLDNIQNTPRYWKQAKYEMLAKLDNLGPFQLFFTLSCADMRWDENFAAILRDRGWHINYEVIKDEEGNWDTIVKAKVKEKDEWKPIKQFIKEDVDESLHDLVRGNVLSATRYYHHRVKQFINKVVMGENNPMNVKYYTYKVEVQDRAAGHIHGTLWLNMNKIENLIRGPDGRLRQKTKEESDTQGPFQQLTGAFIKFRTNGTLTRDEINAVRNFVDEFTTVCTHENTVGKEVARIALEVNKHHHTKTCRKHDTTCRFGYPRFPAPYTIIVEPYKAQSTEEKEAVLSNYRKILRKVKDVLEDNEITTKIMERYSKQSESKEEYKENIVSRIKDLLKIAGVDYGEYIQALGTSKSGYSIVQMRDIDETYINSYNTEWLRAWNGNMDIQVVLDYFAVITTMQRMIQVLWKL